MRNIANTLGNMYHHFLCGNQRNPFAVALYALFAYFVISVSYDITATSDMLSRILSVGGSTFIFLGVLPAGVYWIDKVFVPSLHRQQEG